MKEQWRNNQAPESVLPRYVDITTYYEKGCQYVSRAQEGSSRGLF
jgi:hypothetical protein